MPTSVDSNDDDSFIILGTSPGTSLDAQCGNSSLDAKCRNTGAMLDTKSRKTGAMLDVDGRVGAILSADGALDRTGLGDAPDRAGLEDALKDMSDEAGMAFKAHFQLGDCPSPASMMVASAIVSDSSAPELHQRVGELLDENLILRETLKQNNDSMKEQFLMIASCQEDMLRTQALHKEKFEETRDLVERLRNENKKLKQDLMRKSDAESQTSGASGPSSGLEFVTSPDDDTVNKLTAQLELIEKQRRQVLVDNEKLTWQKESLEHIIDATSKERDELKEKLHNLELQLSSKDSEHSTQINKLKSTLQEVQDKLQIATSITSVSSDEVSKRESLIQQLEAKVSALQTDLKNSQLRNLELENVKLEFTKHRSSLSETVRVYKEQIHELHNRLKEAQTTVFQPVRVSLGDSREGSPSGPESIGQMRNVKIYDKTLKHLADLLNCLTNGLTDSLVETMGVVASLQDFKLERATADQVKACLGDLQQRLQEQHGSALDYVSKVKSTLTIFEGIFKDYNELLKKSLTKHEPKPATPNVEALTTALLARGQELKTMEAELKRLRSEHDERDLLKAQMDLYKTDFEAEREAREKMACEKENIMTDLRSAQRRIKDLTTQLDEVRRLDPNVHWSATSRAAPSAPAPASARRAQTSSCTATARSASTANTGTAPKMATKKKKISEDKSVELPSTPPPARYDCPVCDRPFKTLVLLQQHVDSCLL